MSTDPRPTKQQRRDAARQARIEAEQAQAAAALRRKRLRTVLVVLGAAAVVVVIAIVVSSSGGGGAKNRPAAAQKSNGPVPGQRESAAMLDGIPQSGIYLGKPTAPVRLVEFADLQCPYCAQWSAVAFDDIVEDYVRPGKVRLVFGGLTFLGPDSERGLRFALAAGRQGRLWNVVHLLYANQGAENSGWLDDDVLRRVGQATPGLQVDQALEDASSLPVSDGVEAMGNQATALGIQGTPSFAAGRTNGRLAPVQISSLDADGLRPALDSLLAGD